METDEVTAANDLLQFLINNVNECPPFGVRNILLESLGGESTIPLLEVLHAAGHAIQVSGGERDRWISYAPNGKQNGPLVRGTRPFVVDDPEVFADAA